MQLIFNTSHAAFFLQAGGEQVQAVTSGCRGSLCGPEGMQVMMVAMVLVSAILSIVCAFNFFREDKEEQFTPLCPELVAASEQQFKLALNQEREQLEDPDAPETTEVSGLKHACRVVIDYPERADPFRPGASGVAATVRLVSDRDLLASVVVRNVSMQGQGLALCRGGNDIFGFVELEEASCRYHVRHRTGVHMMTLAGDFRSMHVGFFNPAREQVGSIKLEGGECSGRVLQQIDAGLMLASFLGAFVHQRLLTGAPAPAAPLPHWPEQDEGPAVAAAEGGEVPSPRPASEPAGGAGASGELVGDEPVF